MIDVPLLDFCGTHSQKRAAEILGVTPGRIHQMLKDKEEVFIILYDDGREATGKRVERYPKRTA